MFEYPMCRNSAETGVYYYLLPEFNYQLHELPFMGELRALMLSDSSDFLQVPTSEHFKAFLALSDKYQHNDYY